MTAPSNAPSTTDVASYLSETQGSNPAFDDAELIDVIAAEVSDQVNRLRFPLDADGNPTYSPALREALCRRVARNLAVRALPLGFQATVTDSGPGATYLGSSDPEVRRLEAPYRKLVCG